MDVITKGNNWQIIGQMDERDSLEDLLEKSKLTDKSTIEVDFSQLKFANSSGLMLWLKFLRQSKIKVIYQRCPVWLIHQFNMLNGFFENDSEVESFYVPFFCEKTGSEEKHLFYTGKDIPLLKDYSGYNVPIPAEVSAGMEADIDPEFYFAFLSDYFV